MNFIFSTMSFFMFLSGLINCMERNNQIIDGRIVITGNSAFYGSDKLHKQLKETLGIESTIEDPLIPVKIEYSERNGLKEISYLPIKELFLGKNGTTLPFSSGENQIVLTCAENNNVGVSFEKQHEKCVTTFGDKLNMLDSIGQVGAENYAALRDELLVRGLIEKGYSGNKRGGFTFITFRHHPKTGFDKKRYFPVSGSVHKHIASRQLSHKRSFK